MKKTLLSLTILVCLGCKKEVPFDYAILSGKIINQNADQLILSSNERVIEEMISVAEDGSFNDTLKLKLGFYVINDGINTTYLSLGPGDNINITYDKKDHKNTLNVTGKGAEKSKYLIVKDKTLKTLKGDDLKSLFKLDEKDFKFKFDNIKSILLDTLSSFKDLPNQFKTLEARNINYEILKMYYIYGPTHARLIEAPSFTVSGFFSSELSGLDYHHEEDFAFSSSYQYLVKSHYRELSKALAKRDSIADYVAWIKTIETIPSALIHDKLLFDNAINEITYTDDVEKFYNAHINAISNEVVKSKITGVYNKLISLNPGHESPAFVNYENYDGGTTSLDDLKGSYIYIDVWATWCAPCIKEMPHLKKIESNYGDKNVTFVGISIDNISNREKWRKMIEQKKLGGIQLIADQDWNSGFIKEYLINGIPRYILIGPDGNIISSDAPRPSDPDLKKLFDTLKM